MDTEETPLFQLPVPKLLTHNMQDVDDNINFSGIDRIGSVDSGGGGGGGGGGDDPDWDEKTFWAVEVSGSSNVPSQYIFKVKEV